MILSRHCAVPTGCGLWNTTCTDYSPFQTVPIHTCTEGFILFNSLWTNKWSYLDTVLFQLDVVCGIPHVLTILHSKLFQSIHCTEGLISFNNLWTNKWSYLDTVLFQLDVVCGIPHILTILHSKLFQSIPVQKVLSHSITFEPIMILSRHCAVPTGCGLWNTTCTDYSPFQSVPIHTCTEGLISFNMLWTNNLSYLDPVLFQQDVVCGIPHVLTILHSNLFQSIPVQKVLSHSITFEPIMILSRHCAVPTGCGLWNTTCTDYSPFQTVPIHTCTEGFISFNNLWTNKWSY